MMETLVTILLVFGIAWGLFTAYVLVDSWQHLRRATKATEATLQQVRAQTATLSELKSEAHRTTLMLQAEYTRNRGLPEPDGEGQGGRWPSSPAMWPSSRPTGGNAGDFW